MSTNNWYTIKSGIPKDLILSDNCSDSLEIILKEQELEGYWDNFNLEMKEVSKLNPDIKFILNWIVDEDETPESEFHYLGGFVVKYLESEKIMVKKSVTPWND